VVDVRSGDVSIDGRPVIAYSFAARRGDASWEVLDGRLPTGADEVMLGSTLADDLDISPGERVAVGDAVTMTVTGLGIGPAFSGEELGSAVLLDSAAFTIAAPTGTFREAYLRTARDVDVGAVAAELGGDLELATRELPTEVRNIAELGSLPTMFGGFLALLALVALAHGVAVTTRQRQDDFAVVRALGATPVQVGAIVVTMTLTTVLIGVAIGVPLGWAVARFVWGGLARSVGVADDALVPPGVAAIVVMAIVLAVVVAAIPACRAARTMTRPAARPD
jgi:putative ABC transport system permease protein